MSERAARLLIFGTSASILVIEIIAGRLMAPYVGVTIEAFTGIIGTVLAAIALGNWWGGRAADRRDARTLLGPLLVAGGLLTILAPLIVTWMGPALRGTEPIQIVLLTALSFIAPAIALAAVTPVVVKLRLTDLDETGSVVGRFSAVGTAGALFGTFITGFVLLGSFPTRPIIVALGVAVVVTGVALHAGFRRAGGSALGLLVAAVVLGGATMAVAGPCDTETTYSCAAVVTDPDRASGRTLWLDNARHSYVDIADPTHLEFRYIRLMAGVVETLDLGNDPHVLSIGAGGFTLPRWLDETRPSSTQTILEIDDELVDLAVERLDLSPTVAGRVLVGDARNTIARVTEPVDLVLADAFGGFVVPWHLTTEQFLADVAATMTPDAVFIMNLIDYPPRAFARAELATLTTVFGHVAVLAPPAYFDGDAGGNYVIVASKSPLDTSRLAGAASGGGATVLDGARLTEWIAGAAVLTDDFAPVDQLISR